MSAPLGEQRFFEYARERHCIKLQRDNGQPLFQGHWTRDPILQEYRFCNVFREDDTTTRWFREAVRDPYRHSMDVVFATICFRWFNRIETGMRLADANLLFNWDGDRARTALKDLQPLVTGAFMVKSPIGVSPKLEGLIQCLDRVWTERSTLYLKWDHLSLEESWRLLLQFPYLGPFMSYEIVTDLRHTMCLESAGDIMTWASAGPGAIRGAGRVDHENEKTYAGNTKADRIAILGVMRGLLSRSKDDKYWPQRWPSWEMREVEHTLCEYDKYERVRLGQGRPRQRYRMKGES